MITAELIAAAFVIQGIGLALVFKNGYRGMRQQPTKYTKMFDMIPLGNALMVLMLLAAASSLLANVNIGQDVTFNSITVTNGINATIYTNLPSVWNVITANFVLSTNSIGSNFIYVNTITATNYLNLPAVAASCGSVCIANTFLGFDANSKLAINSITTNVLYAGVSNSATFSGNVFNGNFFGALSSNSARFNGNVLTANWINVAFDANANNIIANTITATTGVSTPTVTANTFTTSNGLLTGVGQIRWNAPSFSNKQWATNTVFTNTNATLWIIYAQQLSPGATTPRVFVQEDTLANPSNVILDEHAFPAGSNSMFTIIVPYGFSFNSIWSRMVFNSIFVR